VADHHCGRATAELGRIWPLEWHLAPRDISGRRSTARRQVNPERPWDELDRSHHPCPGTFVLLLLIKPM
jgi:hypothetical protein